MLDGGLRMRAMILPDEFLDHDSPTAMYARAGLDAKGIVAKVFDALGKDYKTETVDVATGDSGVRDRAWKRIEAATTAAESAADLSKMEPSARRSG